MTFKALKILPAELGGFIVFREGERGDFNPPLFAGSLPDCLETMRAQFADKPVGPSDANKMNDFRKAWS